MEIIIKKFYDLTLDQLYQVIKLRVDFFVVEQACPYPEVDNQDQEAIHILLVNEEELVAYARLLPINALRKHVTIGRVIARDRGQGYGRQVMETAIQVAYNQMEADQIYLEAQIYAREFYEKLGFQQIGEIFIADNIPHLPVK